MALFFHRNKGNSIRQEKTIEALVPLYFGFVAGFSNATKNVSSHESEILIEKIYEAFGKKKSYILKKWK